MRFPAIEYFAKTAAASAIIIIAAIRVVLLRASGAAGRVVGTEPMKWINTLMSYPLVVSYYMDH